MSAFSAFMKQNKKVKENEKYAPTTSLLDADGNPLEWEFQHLTSRDNEAIRDACTIEVQVTGKPNLFRPKLNTSKYLAQMIVASTVYPNLNDSELQDSYGVMKPEELLYEMIDDPGEYNDLSAWVQKFNGFDVSMDDKREQAKN